MKSGTINGNTKCLFSSLAKTVARVQCNLEFAGDVLVLSNSPVRDFLKKFRTKQEQAFNLLSLSLSLVCMTEGYQMFFDFQRPPNLHLNRECFELLQEIQRCFISCVFLL